MYSTRAFGRPTASSPSPTTREHVFLGNYIRMVKKVCRSSTRGVISEGDVSQLPLECRQLDVLPGQAPKPAVKMNNLYRLVNLPLSSRSWE